VSLALLCTIRVADYHHTGLEWRTAVAGEASEDSERAALGTAPRSQLQGKPAPSAIAIGQVSRIAIAAEQLQWRKVRAI
jgi:hypothetical protein